ncbi:hypothetical protein [Methanimicrococcus blatticola]|uniref:hypothetical protein n=1 Tax=Methanimicrococcus blatticola TaxID=91560 RepID=UPI00105DC898|nr:hypothetical protein [Methanimicrococcus blatticola]MBZ3936016.1 hypothetical protein [Methanimicrococcus blatticola]MCC2509371.1 hypothetical protein [Methanimicrococcus blatticola]
MKITPENRHCWKEMCSRTFENKTMQTKKTTKINQTENQNNQEAVAEKSLKMIIFIDTLSELFQNEKQTEKKNEKQKEEKNEKQNENSAQDRNDEDSARYENDEEEEYRIFSFVKEIKNGINDQ